MKKTRIIALALALITLTFVFAACNTSTPKVKTNCTVSVVVGGETLLNKFAYVVEGTEARPATVIQAATEAFITCDIPYEANEDSLVSVTFDGVVYAAGNDGENINAWIVRLNGKEPDSGMASTAKVEEGMDIEFELISIPIENKEPVADPEE